MKHFVNTAKIVFFIFSSQTLAGDLTPTVSNGETPSGTRYTLTLEENLRVGPGEGDDFLWPQVGTAVQADESGYMYVTCPTENRITVLNANGELVRHLGGPGQGPSEYQGLISFQVLADGRGVAFEMNGPTSNFSWYDKELGFVGKTKLGKSMAKMFQTAALSPDGDLFFTQIIGINQAAGKMIIRYAIMDMKGKIKNKIANFNNPMPTPDIVKSTDHFARYMGQSLTSESKGLVGFAAFDNNNNIYTATARNYEITRWSPDMEKQLVITRKYKPIALTEKEINAVINPLVETLRAKMPPQMSHLFAESTIRKAVAMAEFPPVKHPINGLFVLEDGTLAVTHEIDLLEKKMTVDLFDKSGGYLGDYTQAAPGLNSWNLVFKNGYLYRIEANEDNENVLVRYRYKLMPANEG